MDVFVNKVILIVTPLFTRQINTKPHHHSYYMMVVRSVMNRKGEVIRFIRTRAVHSVVV